MTRGWRVAGSGVGIEQGVACTVTRINDWDPWRGSGVGIEEEQLGNIWGAFNQGSAGMARQYGGAHPPPPLPPPPQGSQYAPSIRRHTSCAHARCGRKSACRQLSRPVAFRKLSRPIACRQYGGRHSSPSLFGHDPRMWV
jgi:hypothetical protein